MKFELMTEFLNFYIGYVFAFILTFYLRTFQVYLLTSFVHFLHCWIYFSFLTFVAGNWQPFLTLTYPRLFVNFPEEAFSWIFKRALCRYLIKYSYALMLVLRKEDTAMLLKMSCSLLPIHLCRLPRHQGLFMYSMTLLFGSFFKRFF